MVTRITINNRCSVSHSIVALKTFFTSSSKGRENKIPKNIDPKRRVYPTWTFFLIKMTRKTKTISILRMGIMFSGNKW
jgi:hypothetical protein